MSNPINDLAIVQDQFQLMAMAVEIEDENAVRFNNNLEAMFNEIKKNMSAMSNRILVLEQEKATYSTNAETIAKAHQSEVQALTGQIAQLNLRLDKSSENQKSQAQEIFDLQEQLDIVRQAYNGHTHSTNLSPLQGYQEYRSNSLKVFYGPSTPIKHLDIVRKERAEAIALEKKKKEEGIAEAKAAAKANNCKQQ